MGLFEGLVGAVVGGTIDGLIGDDPIGEGVVIGGILGSLFDIGDTKREYLRMEMFTILDREYKIGNISTTEYKEALDVLLENPGKTFTFK